MSGWLTLAAIALFAASAYLASLWMHPWVPCRACAGSGRARDPVFTRAYGTCPRCGGRGRKARPAVRILQPARAKRMTSAGPDHKDADHRRPS